MTHHPQPTKRERRDAARAERLAAEEREQSAAARRKRLALLGALLAAAAAVILAVVLISSGGKDKPMVEDGGKLADAGKVEKMFKGIPQKGIVLGEPSAPVTVVVFADPQCPFCRDFDETELPGIVDKYVRPGKAKLELRMRAFLGADSQKAADALYAAAAQNKMWETAGIMYHNQGEENAGWVTDDFINKMFGSVTGLDAAKAKREMVAEGPKEKLAEAETLAQRYGSQSTPEIYVGKDTASAEKTSGPTEKDVSKAIDEITAAAQ